MKPIKKAYKLLYKQLNKRLSKDDLQYLKRIDSILLYILKE